MRVMKTLQSWMVVGSMLAIITTCLAGCGGGTSANAGEVTTSTSAAAPTTTTAAVTIETTQPTEATPPVATTGQLRLIVNPNHTIFAQAERVLLYLTDSALNYGADPYGEGFNPNRLIYGPVDIRTRDFVVGRSTTPEVTWSDVPPGRYQAELLLLRNDGRPIGRYVVSVDIFVGETTTVDQPNWGNFGIAFAAQQRPTPWDHQGLAPAYESKASVSRDVTALDPLIAPGGVLSLFLVDRVGKAIHYIVRNGETDWSSGPVPEYLSNVHGFTTMYPWSGFDQYFDRAPQAGLSRFGVPFEDWSIDFHGVDVLDQVGAAGRIAAIYRNTLGQYRVRLATVSPYVIEADFDIGRVDQFHGVDSYGEPLSIAIEPDLDYIWVGYRNGWLRQIALDGISGRAIQYGVGNPIVDLCMVDERYLAFINAAKGKVEFFNTLTYLWPDIPLAVPGVEQIVSCEGDSRLAVIRRDATNGKKYLEYFNRTK